MRFHWLLLSAFSSFLLALPAQAGKLVFWRFEQDQNRLVFTTDDRVQPTAQLIPNPTRVVIDLPGIVLGQPSVTENFGGTIKSVRIGQFDAQTTRLVIEIAPGYTVDPQQVKIRGISPTQWTVDLPQPQRVNSSSDTSPPPVPASNTSNSRPPAPDSSTSTSRPPAPTNNGSGDFQVTRNGLFVRLDRNGDERKISSKRSRDRQKIEFELPGATLANNLLGQTFPVNNYGVSQIQFEQSSESMARITLSVSSKSPEWQALYSRFGGLVLLPQGGLSSFNDRNPSTSPAPISINIPQNQPQPQQAIIQSVDLNSVNTQLNIRSDRPIRGNGNWNLNQGVYEIRIDNALLSDSFRGPRLGQRSGIYQLRVRQEDADTVLIMVQPALGYQLGQLLQTDEQLLALELRSLRTYQDFPSPPVARPPNPNYPPILSDPTPPPRQNLPKGRTLVILDPGHGGKDPGAIGLGGLQEKNVILPISQMVAKILEQQGIQVMLTRSSDYFVSLQGRTDMANRAGASLFVSIHANSMGAGRPDVSGLEVYYFGDRRLADTIYRSIVRGVNVKERGVRRARFYVLRNSKMPSTLVEVGFVTGQEDAPKLSNSNYQRQMAEAIARGITEFIKANR